MVEETEGEEADCANQRGWAEGEEDEAAAAAAAAGGILLLLLLLLLLEEEAAAAALLLLLFASLRRALMDDEVDIFLRFAVVVSAVSGFLFFQTLSIFMVVVRTSS